MHKFKFTDLPFWRHQIIRLRLRTWLLPFLLILPYFLSLVWLQSQGLVWLLQIMLAPLFMGLILGAMTLLLARLEFRNFPRKR